MTRCWCGGSRLDTFGEGYLECAACGTLVRAERGTADVTRVADEERDVYGRAYWFERQAELGLPDLEARGRADLPERCLYWLDQLLRYKAPPGRALELGAAHGAFTALLAWAGFDATGLELSPWVAERARRVFGVPMLVGPLEDQDLAPGSFDLIAAMDVFEHLPAPQATAARCAELLAADGALLLQTPCRQPGRGLEELRGAGDRFVEMLLPEHLHLFSAAAIRELLGRAGLTEVVFLPALFADYDMFLIAGRRPLAERTETGPRLPERPSARLVEALLDLRASRARERERNDELEAAYRQADADRVERQRQVDELETAYRQADVDRVERRRQVDQLERDYRQADLDRVERQRQIDELETAYRQADADRVERRRQVDQLERDYRQADADRVERQRQIDELEAACRQADADRVERQRQIDEIAVAYRQADADRVERQRRIDELEAACRQADADRVERRRQVDQLEQDYRQADADRVERQRRIDELEASYRQADADRVERRRRIDELEAARRRADADRVVLEQRLAEQRQAVAGLETERDDLERRLQRLRGLVLDHRNSRVYRALVRVGRWRAYEERVQQALGEHRSRAAPPPLAGARQEVEWTIEPGPAVRGGGAIAVDLTALLPGGENGGAKRVATSLVRLFARLAPERDFVLLTSAPCHVELAALEAPNVRRRPLGTDPSALAELLAGEPFALLFCPLTAPPWSDPRVPLVCLVHDLQYLAYPDFFDDAERGGRDDAFRRAVRWSEKIVTDSEYVRRTILEHAGLGEDRVVAIPIGFAGGCPEIGEEEADAVLARHGLEREGYFLYPANFWPHKNHRMLLVAFGQLHRRHPDLKLVLTGAERPDPEPLVEASRRMGLGDAVRVAGWVSDGELAALLRGCRALVFPSLYEGFGMPVVEAMACGRPVACSRATSLPEVAGDAALYFDPRRPGEIAGALERLARGGDDVEELRRRGPRRARELGDADSTARAYLDLFDAVAAAPRRFRDRLAGVYGDGWTPARAVVSHAAGRRELELGLANPRGESVSVELCGHRATLAPQTSLVVRCRLPAAGGCLELDVSPTFCPRERGFSADPRHLGLELWSCRLAGGGDDLDLLARSADG